MSFRRLQRAQERPFRLPPLCGEAHGYNLHAAVVIRRGNREGLERLCRYVLRPPLARTRLQRRGDGLLVLTLRKPYANRTTDFIFSEVAAERSDVGESPTGGRDRTAGAAPRRAGPACAEERRVLPRRTRAAAPVPEPGDSRATREDRRAEAADEEGTGEVPLARLGRLALAGVRGRWSGVRLRWPTGPPRRGPTARDSGRPRELGALRGEPPAEGPSAGGLSPRSRREGPVGGHPCVRRHERARGGPALDRRTPTLAKGPAGVWGGAPQTRFTKTVLCATGDREGGPPKR